MYLGCHVSIAGGLVNAPLNAAALGCEVFQMFSRSPHGGWVAPLNDEIAAQFKKNAELCAQREWYIHTPYFINFPSAKNSTRYGSSAVVREELERGTILGAKYVMTHQGSYKDLGPEEGFEKMIEGLMRVFDGYHGTTELLLEISAGAGQIVGDTFEEMAAILDHKKLKKFPIGICYDTQHGFASGYDIRTPEAVDATMKKFDSIIGLERLKMFHCNDSMVPFDSHKDRHEHIGHGAIGKAGFEALLRYPKLKDKNFILETEHDKVREDLAILKAIRG